MRDLELVLVLVLVAALGGPATASYVGTKAPAEVMPSLPAVELPEWWDREFRYIGNAEHEQVMARALLHKLSEETGPSAEDDPKGWLHRAQKSADTHEALTWYRKAAEAGLPEAQASLAAADLSGLVVPQNPVRTLMWLIISADTAREDLRGYLYGLRLLVTGRLSVEQLAEADRLARDWTPTQN